MPNPHLTKGFRLAATVLIDNYWIPRQEVERYLARRQYWSQALMAYNLRQPRRHRPPPQQIPITGTNTGFA